MREAMKNISSASIPQCWGDRTGILEQAYITCACCLALHVQGEGGLCWSCSLGTARAAPGSCRVSACAGVSLVQAVCHSLPAWATRVSALCLTHSDRDLPTRLLLPRSNFSCSIPQPSTAGESPSKTESGAVCGVIWVGRIKSDFVSAVLLGVLTKTSKCKQISRGNGCYRSEKTKSTGSIWSILGRLLGPLKIFFFNFFFLKMCLHLSQKVNICHFFSYMHHEDQSKQTKKKSCWIFKAVATSFLEGTGVWATFEMPSACCWLVPSWSSWWCT